MTSKSERKFINIYIVCDTDGCKINIQLRRIWKSLWKWAFKVRIRKVSKKVFKKGKRIFFAGNEKFIHWRLKSINKVFFVGLLLLEVAKRTS